MSFSIRLSPEPVRSLAHTSIGAAYMGIGTALDHKARIINISNLTNGQLMISFDGVHDHFPLVPASFLHLDVCKNDLGLGLMSLEIGERLYVKELNAVWAPTKGSVYLTVFYGKDE